MPVWRGEINNSTGSFGLMGFGVATAARGWATKNDVLNTFSPAKIKSWVKAKRP
jgi:histidinol phosphatase-like PHP family hydrolase